MATAWKKPAILIPVVGGIGILMCATTGSRTEDFRHSKAPSAAKIRPVAAACFETVPGTPAADAAPMAKESTTAYLTPADPVGEEASIDELEAEEVESARIRELYHGGSREVKRRCLTRLHGAAAADCADLLLAALEQTSAELRRAAVQALLSCGRSLARSLILPRYPIERDSDIREMMVYTLTGVEGEGELGALLQDLWNLESDAAVRRVIATHLAPVARSDREGAARILAAWRFGERDSRLSEFLDDMRRAILERG